MTSNDLLFHIWPWKWPPIVLLLPEMDSSWSKYIQKHVSIKSLCWLVQKLYFAYIIRLKVMITTTCTKEFCIALMITHIKSNNSTIKCSQSPFSGSNKPYYSRILIFSYTISRIYSIIFVKLVHKLCILFLQCWFTLNQSILMVYLTLKVPQPLGILFSPILALKRHHTKKMVKTESIILNSLKRIR